MGGLWGGTTETVPRHKRQQTQQQRGNDRVKAQKLHFQRGQYGIQDAAYDHRAQRASRVGAFPVKAQHQRPQEDGFRGRRRPAGSARLSSPAAAEAASSNKTPSRSVMPADMRLSRFSLVA